MRPGASSGRRLRVPEARAAAWLVFFFSKCGFRDTGVISIGVEGLGLRTHILRLWGLRTILYKALGLFLSPWVLVL